MRGSGIILHISSLPSSYGIGTLGREAYDFVDWLKLSGQTYWQVLPLGPISFGDSPYQTLSAFAGNHYFIDFELLTQEGLIKKEEYEHLIWETKRNVVDYDLQYINRVSILKLAYQRFIHRDLIDFTNFKSNHKLWLDDYSLFMSLKYHFNQTIWSSWDEAIKNRTQSAMIDYQNKLRVEIDFWAFTQYIFFKQWYSLKKYANENGISMIGDMAIYVAYDSSDVWSNSRLFQLNEHKLPIEVAGVPSDDFAKEGQLWGNPLYDWDFLQMNNYDWWVWRVKHAKQMYDVIRIDHFRGFESYYAVKASAKNAIEGTWRKGPNSELFDQIKAELGQVNIIAEDLGFITPEVKQMLVNVGFPGMKVLEFAFDGRIDNEYLPHNYRRNCVVYTSTHDCDTVEGWFKRLSLKQKNYVYQYLKIENKDSRVWKFIESAWASVANLAICQMQDILELDNTARMNTPSTIGINWIWRAKKSYFDDKLAAKLRAITTLYNR